MTPLGIEPTTFQFVVQCFNQLCHRMPWHTHSYFVLVICQYCHELTFSLLPRRGWIFVLWRFILQFWFQISKPWMIVQSINVHLQSHNDVAVRLQLSCKLVSCLNFLFSISNAWPHVLGKHTSETQIMGTCVFAHLTQCTSLGVSKSCFSIEHRARRCSWDWCASWCALLFENLSLLLFPHFLCDFLVASDVFLQFFRDVKLFVWLIIGYSQHKQLWQCEVLCCPLLSHVARLASTHCVTCHVTCWYTYRSNTVVLSGVAMVYQIAQSRHFILLYDIIRACESDAALKECCLFMWRTNLLPFRLQDCTKSKEGNRY
jgi:hypothetical protein